jgi:broad specificity phosphatase PhoE/predicted kinase
MVECLPNKDIKIMKDNKIYIIMVGLPGRGKSTTAMRLMDTFNHDSISTKIFNNGNLRRKFKNLKDSYSAEFYHPDNEKGVELRKMFAMINMERARDYLSGKGQIAIMDATNVSRERREMMEHFLCDHPTLFIECINEDTEILNLSIIEKIKTPEFENVCEEEAYEHLEKRIEYYKMIYSHLESERNFIKIDSLHNRILGEKMTDQISLYSRIRDFLVTDIVKNLFLIRHTETHFNLQDRIGGDPLLTPKGMQQAQALASFFKRRNISYIFTSKKVRTQQTAQPIKDLQKNCTIIPLSEFNEIDAGICEGMTYSEIKERMQEVHKSREIDKYNYVYPDGEGYLTMKERIEIGIKKAFYLNRNSDNIMIIGHRAVNRMILSHFLYRRMEDVPYIYVPQDKFYHIVGTQDKKLFQLKKYY